MYFKHDFDNVRLGHCYDCASELSILVDYISQSKKPDSHEHLEDMVIEFSRDIDRFARPIPAFKAREKKSMDTSFNY